MKRMAEVFDFYSKKRRSEDQGPEATDVAGALEEHGKYVGKLPKPDAERLRALVDTINRKKVYIDKQIDEFNELYDEYSVDIGVSLAALNVDPEMIKEDMGVIVDKRGNVWVVPSDKKEAFEALLNGQ